MNKWCFLLMAACLLAPDTGHAALKARDDVKAEDAFNPNPAPDDLILPMPCGQSMVLKAVGVRGKGLLWDLETRFGRRDGGSDDRGYYDSPYASAISGPSPRVIHPEMSEIHSSRISLPTGGRKSRPPTRTPTPCNSILKANTR